LGRLSIRTYRLDQAAAPDGWVEALHVDTRGRLWVAGAEGGLALYDRDHDRFVTIAQGHGALSPGYVRSIADDGAGGFWIGAGRELDHFDPAAGAMTALRHRDNDPRSPPQGLIQAVLRGRDGRLWLGGDFGLVRRDRDQGPFVTVRFPSSALAGGPVSVKTLFQDDGGRLWIGTARHGALALDRGAASPRPVEESPPAESRLGSATINAIVATGAGEVWLAVDGGGVVAVNQTTGATRRIRHDATEPTSLPHDEVSAMLRDRAGSVWIGGYRGLSRHSPNNDAILTVFGGSTSSGGVSAADVLAALPTRDGEVWLGFVSGGVDILDPAGRRIGALRADSERPQSALPKAPVYAMAADGEGDVFVGTKHGLYRVDRGGRRVALVRVPGRDPHGAINALLVRGEDLWIAGAFDGLWVVTTRAGGAKASGRDRVSGLTDPRLSSLATGSAGELWVGAFNGLNRVDLATRVVAPILPDPAVPGALPSSPVSSLLIDQRGRLWVGTLGGGVALDLGPGPDAKPRFRRIGVADGLPTPSIGKLLLDARGHVWASTDDGLAMIDPDTLAVRPLGPADGVAIRNYWVGAGAATPRDELLFGGEGGLTVVRPERLRAWNDHPPLVVTEVRVGAYAVPADRFNGSGSNEPLIVTPGYNRVGVEIASLDYTAPDRNLYASKLEGFDRDWIYRDSRHRSPAHTNLPPGLYTLRLRGSNRDGAWTPGELRVPIRVMPAWYQTWWFKALMAALTLAAVFGLVQARTVVMRRRQRALERQIAARTRELERANAQLAEQAHRDPLTGLLNRRRFFELAGEQLALARRYERPCSVFMVDLDHFKRINDTYGHAGGDEVLIAAARCVVDTIREVDIVARFGGEELAVLLPETDALAACLSAERVRAALAALEIPWEDGEIRVTASIGVALWVPSEGGIQAALDRADRALYRVKEAGRDGVRIEEAVTPIAAGTA
jgi:diguanylate cyclase (GGDEF)-like protein